MLTKAHVVAEPGAPFTWEDVEVDDELREDEVLIEMKASGVCHTDLNFARETTIPNLFPAVFGHEGTYDCIQLVTL
jgi:aryl-alcohol dehydrogenase